LGTRWHGRKRDALASRIVTRDSNLPPGDLSHVRPCRGVAPIINRSVEVPSGHFHATITSGWGATPLEALTAGVVNPESCFPVGNLTQDSSDLSVNVPFGHVHAEISLGRGTAPLDALTSRIVISESRFPPGNVTQKLSVPGRSSDYPTSMSDLQPYVEPMRSVKGLLNFYALGGRLLQQGLITPAPGKQQLDLGHLFG